MRCRFIFNSCTCLIITVNPLLASTPEILLLQLWFHLHEHIIDVLGIFQKTYTSAQVFNTSIDRKEQILTWCGQLTDPLLHLSSPKSLCEGNHFNAKVIAKEEWLNIIQLTFLLSVSGFDYCFVWGFFVFCFGLFFGGGWVGDSGGCVGFLRKFFLWWTKKHLCNSPNPTCRS